MPDIRLGPRSSVEPASACRHTTYRRWSTTRAPSPQGMERMVVPKQRMGDAAVATAPEWCPLRGWRASYKLVSNQNVFRGIQIHTDTKHAGLGVEE